MCSSTCVELGQGSESDLIALLRALEGHADAKARGGAGAAASLARRGHLSAPTLGMIWDICGQVARELKGSGLPSAYDWCVGAALQHVVLRSFLFFQMICWRDEAIILFVRLAVLLRATRLDTAPFRGTLADLRVLGCGIWDFRRCGRFGEGGCAYVRTVWFLM